MFNFFQIMKNSEKEYKGKLTYNRKVEVSWGDAIVYSDLAADRSSNDDEEIDDTVINTYRQDLDSELDVSKK